MAAADKDMRVEPGAVLDPVAAVPEGDDITSKSEMPPAEPGHDVAKAKEGKVFDPNAARRYAAGEDPWLQDSEAISPAHWNKVWDPAEELKVAIAKKEREVKKLQDELKELKKS
jgi:hypothetical protein